MGKTRRKNGEGNGRSCDKDNPHNRGWRKRLDREYHKGNRTKLKGEVTGNIKKSSNTKIRDYKVKCKCNNEDIANENHKSHRTYGYWYTPEEIQDTIPIVENISDHKNHEFNITKFHDNIFLEQNLLEKERDLKNIPSIFVKRLNNIKHIWKKFNQEQQFQLFSLNKILFNSVNKILKTRCLTDDEFLSFAWQNYCLTPHNQIVCNMNDIEVTIKRIGRRSNTKSYVNHRESNKKYEL